MSIKDPFNRTEPSSLPVRKPTQAARAHSPLFPALLMLVSVAIVIFTLLFPSPVATLSSVPLMPLTDATGSAAWNIPGDQDHPPSASGFYLLDSQQQVLAQEAVPALWDAASGWVIRGTLPQAIHETDTVRPYLCMDQTLYLGEAIPAPTETLPNLPGITIEQQPFSDGSVALTLQTELTDLDADNMYIAGFLAGPDADHLSQFGETAMISGVNRYQLIAKATLPQITDDGQYVCVSYYYSLSGNHTDLLGQLSFVLETPVPGVTITSPPPSSTPSPTLPRVTHTPKATETPPVTATPTQTPRSSLPLISSLTTSPTASPTVTPLQPAVTTDVVDAAKTQPDNLWFTLCPPNTRYYFLQLTDQEKTVFAALYDGIMAFEPKIQLPTSCTDAELDRILFVLMYDCPELFQIDGSYQKSYFSNDPDRYTSVSPNYTVDQAEYHSDLATIRTKLDAFQTLQDFGSTEFSHELAIYRYLKDHCYYALDLPDCGNIRGPFLRGYAKCDGYSKALSISLRYYGIAATEICGQTHDQNGIPASLGHSWNTMRIDGNWYLSDLTWDDSTMENMNVTLNAYYPFLNLTEARMMSARTIWPEFLVWTLPTCDSTQANYYVLEGQLIPAGSDLTSAIGDKLLAAYQNGNSEIPLAFESEADFNVALLQLEKMLHAWHDSGVYVQRYSYLYTYEGQTIDLYQVNYSK